MIEFINTPDGMCPLCHNEQATDVQHMIPGTHRAFSEKYGLTVKICRTCHTMLRDGKETADGWTLDELKRLAQIRWEDSHLEFKDPRAAFIKECGKSYL